MPAPGLLMFAKGKPALLLRTAVVASTLDCGLENGCVFSTQWTELKVVLIALAQTVDTSLPTWSAIWKTTDWHVKDFHFWKHEAWKQS